MGCYINSLLYCNEQELPIAAFGIITKTGQRKLYVYFKEFEDFEFLIFLI